MQITKLSLYKGENALGALVAWEVDSNKHLVTIKKAEFGDQHLAVFDNERDAYGHTVVDKNGRTIVFFRGELPDGHFYKDKLDIPFASIALNMFLGKLGKDASWVSYLKMFPSFISIETHADYPLVSMEVAVLLVDESVIDKLAAYENALVLDLNTMMIGDKKVETSALTTKLYDVVKWFHTEIKNTPQLLTDSE